MLLLNNPTGKPIRLWPVVLIFLLTILTIIWIWLFDGLDRQNQILRSISVLGISFLLLFIWLLFFSRLRWKIRLLSLGTVLCVILLSIALFRIKGFTGDLIPILEWSWSKRAGESLTRANTNPGKMDEASWLSSNDYPQFLGPNRNATLSGIGLVHDWSKHPPRLMWQQPVGAGWSAFAIFGNLAVTQEQHGKKEMVVCYNLRSGQIKWRHSDNTRYEKEPGGVGPRATPTIVKGYVYTLGATGTLNCLDLLTGECVWSKNIVNDNNSEVNEWGISCSPLVLDNMVVVSAGGRLEKSLVAYHKDTGDPIWHAGTGRAGYSSPIITNFVDVPQILIFNRGYIVSHNPLNGQIIWRQSWPKQTQHVAQPLPLPENQLFVSTGYGIGCKLFQIHQDKNAEKFQVSLIWETHHLKAKFTNVVHHEGYIYGLDDGILVCLDLTNGQRKWKRGRYGHGQIILVNNLLLIQAESGEIVLVGADPTAHKELSRFAALDGRTWNNPALSGPYLLVRNDQEAACYLLPVGE